MLIVGLAALLASWVFANPPGSAPDETAQYVKAVATAYGQDTGSKVISRPASAALRDQFVAEATRGYLIPARLAPDVRWGCNRAPVETATCLYALMRQAPSSNTARISETTYVGPYLPVVYLPLGVAARIAGSPLRGLYAARFADAAICLTLFALALLLAAPGVMRIALVVATTPTTLFIASTVNVSGMEIAGMVGALSAVLAILDGRRLRLAWCTLTTAGLVLVLARAFGPLWLTLLGGGAVALVSWRAAYSAVVCDRRGRTVVSLLMVAAIMALVWDLLFLPHAHAGPVAAFGFFGRSVRDLPRQVDQIVGNFGFLDTPLPRLALWAGEAAMVVLVGSSVGLSRLRWRLTVVGGLVATLGLSVALDCFTQMPIGFLSQGRYVLPLLAATIVVAGWTVGHSTRNPIVTGWLAGAAGLVMALLQGFGWYVNAHRQAVGDAGPWFFLGHSLWTPPGHWFLWTLVAAIGTMLMLVGVTIEILGRRPPVTPVGDLP